ncbi:MAG: ATP-dependent Clp protease adaptor ClpS [Bdellovibrionota bacterium]
MNWILSIPPLVSSNKPSQPEESPGHGLAIEEETVTRRPRKYAVVLLNDDYTPMDFVVLILKRFFGKEEKESQKIMLDVHKKGSGVAGIFSYEVAEMKVMQVNQFAQLNQYPLKSTLEPLEDEDSQ